MTKICEICDDFCDVGRWTTVNWTCQHSTSAFKKTTEILTQDFHLA